MMRKKRKLLIINRNQFGYHIDSYYYCICGFQDLDITYLCFDLGKPRIDDSMVNCIYLSRAGSILRRSLRLFFTIMAELKKSYDVIFIVYFPACSLLKVLRPCQCFVFDIRTGSTKPNRIKRKFNNYMLRIESCFFKHISVISESLANKLKLPETKVHILPLGATPVYTRPKQFKVLRLLYVGNLSESRRIADTIEGFARFYFKYKDAIDVTYDIVGNDDKMLEELRELSKKKGLSHVVRLPGYIHQSELKERYHEWNVGVSYIPMIEKYDCQPPTKTFEYLLAGMPIIATKTTENKRVINNGNGVLITDSADGFCEGLERMMKNEGQYNSDDIRLNAMCFSWQNIVEENFVPYIERVCAEK